LKKKEILFFVDALLALIVWDGAVVCFILALVFGLEAWDVGLA
jgi:hypothetical protein